MLAVYGLDATGVLVAGRVYEVAVGWEYAVLEIGLAVVE